MTSPSSFGRQGADVTMIQRSPTTVVKSETLMELAFGDLYSEEALARASPPRRRTCCSPPCPTACCPKVRKNSPTRPESAMPKFYERLEGAGFALDFGEDESGLFMKALRTGSGYYIDVGASDLIIKARSRWRAASRSRR